MPFAPMTEQQYRNAGYNTSGSTASTADLSNNQSLKNFMQQMAGMQQQPSLKYRVPASEQPVTQDQPQIRPYRTDQLSGLPADRVGVPSMNQLMSGIYGGGGMGRGMGRGMGFGGFNPYMGGGGMGFGGFNPYMGGGGMGFGGFNPYMGGRGMGRGGFNPYMAQPQPPPMPMQLPDFARQMYGIGQRTNPYMPTTMIPEFSQTKSVPVPSTGYDGSGINPNIGGGRRMYDDNLPILPAPKNPPFAETISPNQFNQLFSRISSGQVMT